MWCSCHSNWAIFHIDTLTLAFLDLELLFAVRELQTWGWRIWEQVFQLFIVDFYKGAPKKKSDASGLILLLKTADSWEEMRERSRHDSCFRTDIMITGVWYTLWYVKPPHHSVSLSTASLAVCKYGPVIAFSCCLYNLESCFIINLLLVRGLVKHFIESKAFWQCLALLAITWSILWIHYWDLLYLAVNRHDLPRLPPLLILKKRTTSNYYFNTFSCHFIY